MPSIVVYIVMLLAFISVSYVSFSIATGINLFATDSPVIEDSNPIPITPTSEKTPTTTPVEDSIDNNDVEIEIDADQTTDEIIELPPVEPVEVVPTNSVHINPNVIFPPKNISFSTHATSGNRKIPNRFADPGDLISISVTHNESESASIVWEQGIGNGSITPVEFSGQGTDTISFTVPSLEFSEEILFRAYIGERTEGSSNSMGIATVYANPVLVEFDEVVMTVHSTEGIDFTNADEPIVMVAGGQIRPIEPGVQTVYIEVEDTQNPILVGQYLGYEVKPLLMNFTGLFDKTIELSLESTAVAFVLRQPIFFGLELSDKPELVRRVEAHERFQDLVEQIGEKVSSGSPCPLQMSCSVTANRIAGEISEEIELEDIVYVSF